MSKEELISIRDFLEEYDSNTQVSDILKRVSILISKEEEEDKNILLRLNSLTGRCWKIKTNGGDLVIVKVNNVAKTLSGSYVIKGDYIELARFSDISSMITRYNNCTFTFDEFKGSKEVTEGYYMSLIDKFDELQKAISL